MTTSTQKPLSGSERTEEELNQAEEEMPTLRKRHPKRVARKKKTLAQFVDIDDALIEELEEEAYKE